MQSFQITQDVLQKGMQNALFHDGNFFFLLAERVRYYPHKPQQVTELYSQALKKAPVNYRVTLSYGNYLAARAEDPKKVGICFSESVRRFPTSGEIQLSAGSHFISMGGTEKGILHLRRSIELNSNLLTQAYNVLYRNGLGGPTLLRLAKTDKELLLLAKYLAGKRTMPRPDLMEVLNHLADKPLNSEQKILIAQYALKAGDLEFAQSQAMEVYRTSESKVEALDLLANIARRNHDPDSFVKLTREMEKFQREQGNLELAAAYGLRAAMAGSRKREDILELLKQYSAYAPAYWQLAILVERESPETAVNYLKKAVELSPQELKYSERLAELYVRLSQYPEAERLAKRFLETPDTQETGYLLLARLKESSGQPGQAAVVLEQAIQKVGGSKELQLRLGKLYDSMDKHSKAAEVYAKYADLSGKIEGHNLAGDAYRKAGNLKAARQQYETALAINPKNKRARNALQNMKNEDTEM